MEEEYSFFMMNGIYKIVPRLVEKSMVGSRWVYRIKHATDGSVVKCNARFVVKGFSCVKGIE